MGQLNRPLLPIVLTGGFLLRRSRCLVRFISKESKNRLVPPRNEKLSHRVLLTKVDLKSSQSASVYRGSGVLLNLFVALPFPVVRYVSGSAGSLTRSTTLSVLDRETTICGAAGQMRYGGWKPPLRSSHRISFIPPKWACPSLSISLTCRE